MFSVMKCGWESGTLDKHLESLESVQLNLDVINAYWKLAGKTEFQT